MRYTEFLLRVAIPILTLLQETCQQFSAPGKNIGCELLFNDTLTSCNGENSADMDSPKRGPGSNQWASLELSNYNDVSIRLSSVQVDTLSVYNSKTAKCIIDSAHTRAIRLESIWSNVSLEWFKNTARESSDHVHIVISDSPRAILSSSKSVQCPRVGMLNVARVGSLTFDIASFNCGRLLVVDSTMTQGLETLELSVTDFITMENSIIDISFPSITIIDAPLILLKNATLKAVEGGQLSLSSDKIIVSGSLYVTKASLDIIVGSAMSPRTLRSLEFTNNIFTNYSIEILKEVNQSWKFADNYFDCTCYLKTVINESMLEDEFHRTNFCHSTKCKLTLGEFLMYLNQNQLCSSPIDDFGDPCLNETESRKLISSTDFNLMYLVNFSSALIIAILVTIFCIKGLGKKQKLGPYLQANNICEVLNQHKGCEIPEGTRKEDSGVNNMPFPDLINCDVYYSPVAEYEPSFNRNSANTESLNCIKCEGDTAQIYSDINESEYAVVDFYNKKSRSSKSDLDGDGENTEVYNQVLDSIEPKKNNGEENFSEIYTDVCDVVYTAVDKSKKKSTRVNPTILSRESVLLSTGSSVLPVGTTKEDYTTRCFKAERVYSEIDDSGNGANIYDEPHLSSDENIVQDGPGNSRICQDCTLERGNSTHACCDVSWKTESVYSEIKDSSDDSSDIYSIPTRF